MSCVWICEMCFFLQLVCYKNMFFMCRVRGCISLLVYQLDVGSKVHRSFSQRSVIN